MKLFGQILVGFLMYASCSLGKNLREKSEVTSDSAVQSYKSIPLVNDVKKYMDEQETKVANLEAEVKELRNDVDNLKRQDL